MARVAELTELQSAGDARVVARHTAAAPVVDLRVQPGADLTFAPDTATYVYVVGSLDGGIEFVLQELPL